MKLVAYYRVSTVRQGRSGLGLDAQKCDVAKFAVGKSLLEEFIEIESGKKGNRPELTRAIALCRATGATLIVAKLDRLARNVAFTAALMESGVEFVACDFPHANKLTIHILAAMAEFEAEQISKRTKAALAAAKARGVDLGSRRPGAHVLTAAESRQAAAKARGVLADKKRQWRASLLPVVESMQATMGQQEIAERLNASGCRTYRGLEWTRRRVEYYLKYARRDRCQGA